jgi:hypothetical protein
MAIVYHHRLMAKMESFVEKLPIQDPPPPPKDAVPLMLIRSEINKMHQLETLRAKYVRRVHVDPADMKTVAQLCRDTAEFLEPDTKKSR